MHVYGSRAFPEAGGLISYGVDRRHIYRRAAEYVDMILKDRTPSELPVEQPTKFELVINLKAAKSTALKRSTQNLQLSTSWAGRSLHLSVQRTCALTRRMSALADIRSDRTDRNSSCQPCKSGRSLSLAIIA